MYSVSSQSIGALLLSASSVGCSLGGHRYRHPVLLYRLRVLAYYHAELRFLYWFFFFCIRVGSLVSGTFWDYFLYLPFECYVLIFKFLYMNSHFYNGNVWELLWGLWHFVIKDTLRSLYSFFELFCFLFLFCFLVLVVLEFVRLLGKCPVYGPRCGCVLPLFFGFYVLCEG